MRFIDDHEASADLARMYVADLMDACYEFRYYDIHVTSDEDRTELGALHDVHLTDGESIIVHVSTQHKLTYDDCARFLANAVGANWKRIIVAHRRDATICPDLLAVFRKGQFSFPYSRPALMVLAKALVKVTDEATEVVESELCSLVCSPNEDFGCHIDSDSQ
jgi:hypothetical protein